MLEGIHVFDDVISLEKQNLLESYFTKHPAFEYGNNLQNLKGIDDTIIFPQWVFPKRKSDTFPNNINVIKTTTLTSQTPDIYAKSIFVKAGVNHGVLEDFAVINERGLVGKVISSSENNSRILLINDRTSSVPVTTMSKKFNAIIKGTDDVKYLISTCEKNEQKPRSWDVLLTSGNASVFPRDILVGKVIKISKDGFLALPYVDFNKLEFVQVINIK